MSRSGTGVSMNKELFVSSTPHETKVGMVEDDLLAEIYLERENEYTLAGSIYKGRVTRVLPGMQSAFVDIGLERDAFLYVSDFMELEEHDEDVTDIVPAGRGVQDMRPQPPPGVEGADVAEVPETPERASRPEFGGAEEPTDGQPSITATGSADPSATAGRDSQERERGGWRGRRRRRGGRRDGRGDGRDRVVEPRVAAPVVESAPEPPPALTRPVEPRRSQQFGPPAGYQPIILPGESISKYRGLVQPPAAQRHWQESRTETSSGSSAASVAASEQPAAAGFPDDEPIFAGAAPDASANVAAPVAELMHEQHDDSRHVHDEHAHDVHMHEDHAEPASSSEASTSVDWNREFRRRELASAGVSSAASDAAEITEEVAEEEREQRSARSEHSDHRSESGHREPEAPAFAAPGTLEEETIDEEEADTI